MPEKLRKIFAALGVLVLVAATSLAQEDSVFTTPTGQQIRLSSLRGRVVVLFFSGVQDPQCRDELKVLQSLNDRFHNKPVSVFWVSVNPSSVASDDKLKSPCGPTGGVAVLRDGDQSAFKRFATGVKQLPTIAIIDKQGNLGGQPRGGFNPDSDFINDLSSLIDELLARK